MSLAKLPKELREHIARAKGYVQKEDMVAALECLSLAVRTAGNVLQIPLQRIAEQHINALLKDIERMPCMQILLDPQATGTSKELIYTHGKEGGLATVLREFAKIILEQQNLSAEQQKALIQNRLQSLLEKAEQAHAAGQWGTGNSFLQRAAKEFALQGHVIERVGQVLMDAQQYADAAQVFARALHNHPKERAFYTLAINAYLRGKDFAGAEKIFQAALQQFGEHPKTLARMASMYALWGKIIEAEECAKKALALDAEDALAKKVLANISSSHLQK